MRLLAAERVVRGAALFFVAFLIIRFRGREQELKDTFNNDVTVLRPVAEQLGWSMDDSKIVRGISRVFELSPATLTWITIGVIGYGTLQVVEAYGLWTISRWGEYLAVVATSIFLPWEIYEVTEKITLLRVGALIINIAAVLWLLWSKRLFGLRGGATAYHAEHHAESLLTVERAAVYAGPAPAVTGSSVSTSSASD